ncbi:hypothetical protein [Symmachiella dynata]|uniref:PEP-CTERM protein-sorting domain-containing protein n=1 Tax=Symmachiella dynata TaxID=2527995 RepID=A0A517ZNL1_9PLAN|nr:hypothetical protein [Symmachiella dynata]QDT48477.1 hypothetical protein Pan258_25190 [Symmachiella dynata]QDU44067.1 hypothetical protein Mal52_25450 [Symmachiella dynata]
MRVAAGASYQEFGLTSRGDVFTIANLSQGDAHLQKAIIDTKSSSADAYFHLSGMSSFPFMAEQESAAETGFTGFGGVTNDSRRMVLEFTDFAPGETFSFQIDVDNRHSWFTSGSDFAGTTLSTVFTSSDNTTELIGAFNATEDSWVSALAELYSPTPRPDFTNPEPSSLLLALIGGATLGAFVLNTKRISSPTD